MLTNAAPEVLPLVDLAVLSQLEGHLDDPKPARAFARDYILGFEDRYLRLTGSVGNRDLPAALDAALSLRSSSTMVGAARLSAIAALFESAVASADLDSARQSLPDIAQCGLDTISALEACYLASA